MDLVGALDFFTSPDGILCLIVGAMIGVGATQLLKGWHLGLIPTVIISGLAGVIGGYVFDVINVIDVGDYADPIIAAVVGAAVILGVLRVVRG
jgi:uncharacterized membrane protein YeaQ/YmgE (transglycosylase-associated protein family)